MSFAFSTAKAGQLSQSRIIRAYTDNGHPPYHASSGVDHRHWRCGTGQTTYLECSQVAAKEQIHDEDFGITTLVLRSKANNKVLARQNLTELWRPLTFNPRTRQYLLATVSEVGVVVSLRGLVSLDEKKATFQDTTFAKQGFIAAAVQISPDARYMAFIGNTDKISMSFLYIMDLDTGRILRIGHPPNPPPVNLNKQKFYKDTWPLWEWQDYTELEPCILTFPMPDLLQVSYGDDSIDQRAKERRVEVWKLGEVFAPHNKTSMELEDGLPYYIPSSTGRVGGSGVSQ